MPTSRVQTSIPIGVEGRQIRVGPCFTTTVREMVGEQFKSFKTALDQPEPVNGSYFCVHLVQISLQNWKTSRTGKCGAKAILLLHGVGKMKVPMDRYLPDPNYWMM